MEVNALVKPFNEFLEFALVLDKPADLVVATSQGFSELCGFLGRFICGKLAHENTLSSVLDLKHPCLICLYHHIAFLGSSDLLLQNHDLVCLQVNLLIKCLQI